MHYAAGHGHLPVVQHIAGLLDDKNPKDSNGITPLHVAAENGHLEVIKYLVPLVTELHPEAGVFWGQKTPLDLARQNGANEVVDYIMNQTLANAGKNAGLDDCTICFSPRVVTYAFYPCGHATFCQRCALQLFENGDKKCAHCRSQITHAFRLFQK